MKLVLVVAGFNSTLEAELKGESEQVDSPFNSATSTIAARWGLSRVS